MKFLCVLWLIALCIPSPFAYSADVTDADVQSRVNQAAFSIKDLLSVPEKSIPTDMMKERQSKNQAPNKR